jgi:hypothetical protein
VAGIMLAGGAGALHLWQSAFWSELGDSGPVCWFGFWVMNTDRQTGRTVTAFLDSPASRPFRRGATFFAAAFLGAVEALTWLIVDPQQFIDCASVRPTRA